MGKHEAKGRNRTNFTSFAKHASHPVVHITSLISLHVVSLAILNKLLPILSLTH